MAEAKNTDALQRRLALLTLNNAFSILTNPQHPMHSVFDDPGALSDLADAIQIHENDDDILAESKIGQMITGNTQVLHLWEKPDHINEDEPEHLCIIHYTDSRGWKQYHVYDYRCGCEQCSIFDKNENVGMLAEDLAHKIRCGWELEDIRDDINEIKDIMNEPIKKNFYTRAGRWILSGICSHPYGAHIIRKLNKMI